MQHTNQPAEDARARITEYVTSGDWWVLVYRISNSFIDIQFKNLLVKLQMGARDSQPKGVDLAHGWLLTRLGLHLALFRRSHCSSERVLYGCNLYREMMAADVEAAKPCIYVPDPMEFISAEACALEKMRMKAVLAADMPKAFA